MKDVLTFLAAVAFAVAASSSAVTVLSSPSFAEEPVHHRHFAPTFSEVDADRDGLVTETEFLTFVEARRAAADFPSPSGGDRFARADADGDGALSREEFEAAPRKIVHRRFRMGDPKELFAQADADRDGVLIEEEFDALFSALPRLRRHPADSGTDDTP